MKTFGFGFYPAGVGSIGDIVTSVNGQIGSVIVDLDSAMEQGSVGIVGTDIVMTRTSLGNELSTLEQSDTYLYTYVQNAFSQGSLMQQESDGVQIGTTLAGGYLGQRYTAIGGQDPVSQMESQYPDLNLSSTDGVLLPWKMIRDYIEENADNHKYDLEFHVDPVNGSDSNNGSEDSPFLTVTHALSVLPFGGVLYLHAGVYNENVTVSGGNIDIKGTSNKSSIVQFAGSFTVDNLGGSSLRLKNIRFDDLQVNGDSSVYLYECEVRSGQNDAVNTKYFEFNNCFVSNYTFNGLTNVNFIGGTVTQITSNVSALNFVNLSSVIQADRISVNSGFLNCSNTTIIDVLANNSSGINAVGSSIVYLKDSSVIGLAGNARGITATGTYKLTNTQIDVVNSNLGTKATQDNESIFDYINLQDNTVVTESIVGLDADGNLGIADTSLYLQDLDSVMSVGSVADVASNIVINRDSLLGFHLNKTASNEIESILHWGTSLSSENTFAGFPVTNFGTSIGESSLSAGFLNTRSGYASLSFAGEGEASGSYASVFGSNVTATKTSGHARGSNAESYGEYASAIGFQVKVGEPTDGAFANASSFALGGVVQAKGVGAFAMGNGYWNGGAVFRYVQANKTGSTNISTVNSSYGETELGANAERGHIYGGLNNSILASGTGSMLLNSTTSTISGTNSVGIGLLNANVVEDDIVILRNLYIDEALNEDSSLTQIMAYDSASKQVKFVSKSTLTNKYDLEFHVDPANGSDSNNGSEDSPFLTVTHALSVLPFGGVLYLHAGVYNENVTVSGGNIDIKGTSNKSSIVQFAGSFTVDNLGASSLRLKNIRFDNLIINGNSSVYLTECDLRQLNTDGVSTKYIELFNTFSQNLNISNGDTGFIAYDSTVQTVNANQNIVTYPNSYTYFKDCPSVVGVVINNGIGIAENSTIFDDGTGIGITGVGASSTLYLINSAVVNGAVAGIVNGVNYSLRNTNIDIVNSNFTGLDVSTDNDSVFNNIVLNNPDTVNQGIIGYDVNGKLGIANSSLYLQDLQSVLEQGSVGAVNSKIVGASTNGTIFNVEQGIGIGNDEIELFLRGANPGIFKQMMMDDNTWVIWDTYNDRGMQYLQDYSVEGISFAGDRWITDAGYVNSQIGAIGLQEVLTVDPNTTSGHVIDVGVNQFDIIGEPDRNLVSTFSQNDLLGSVGIGMALENTATNSVGIFVIEDDSLGIGYIDFNTGDTSSFFANNNTTDVFSQGATNFIRHVSATDGTLNDSSQIWVKNDHIDFIINNIVGNDVDLRFEEAGGLRVLTSVAQYITDSVSGTLMPKQYIDDTIGAVGFQEVLDTDSNLTGLNVITTGSDADLLSFGDVFGVNGTATGGIALFQDTNGIYQTAIVSGDGTSAVSFASQDAGGGDVYWRISSSNSTGQNLSGMDVRHAEGITFFRNQGGVVQTNVEVWHNENGMGLAPTASISGYLSASTIRSFVPKKYIDDRSFVPEVTTIERGSLDTSQVNHCIDTDEALPLWFYSGAWRNSSGAIV